MACTLLLISSSEIEGLDESNYVFSCALTSRNVGPIPLQVTPKLSPDAMVSNLEEDCSYLEWKQQEGHRVRHRLFLLFSEYYRLSNREKHLISSSNIVLSTDSVCKETNTTHLDRRTLAEISSILSIDVICFKACRYWCSRFISICLLLLGCLYAIPLYFVCCFNLCLLTFWILA